MVVVNLGPLEPCAYPPLLSVGAHAVRGCTIQSSEEEGHQIRDPMSILELRVGDDRSGDNDDVDRA